MEPQEPFIEYHGPAAIHNMACAVIAHQPAVLDMSQGIFQPSWKAQERGWRLVRADTWLRKMVLKFLFDN